MAKISFEKEIDISKLLEKLRDKPVRRYSYVQECLSVSTKDEIGIIISKELYDDILVVIKKYNEELSKQKKSETMCDDCATGPDDSYCDCTHEFKQKKDKKMHMQRIAYDDILTLLDSYLSGI